jgi:hypothetical protein
MKIKKFEKLNENRIDGLEYLSEYELISTLKLRSMNNELMFEALEIDLI